MQNYLACGEYEGNTIKENIIWMCINLMVKMVDIHY